MTGKGKPRKGDIETSFEVRSFDADISLEEYQNLPKNGLYIILENLRSAFNVGAIFRLCDCLRVKGLYLCGYTAHPPHVKLEKTSLGTIQYVPWRHFETAAEAIAQVRESGVPVWAAETTSISEPYDSGEMPEEVAVVFGNEALGVEKETLESCDRLIEIPVLGFKNSLNVATACAVIGYEIVGRQRSRRGPD